MRASTARGRPLAVFALVAAAAIALDQASKALALVHLQQTALPLVGGLIQLTPTRNTGSAFGLATPPWVAAGVSVIVSVVVLVYVTRGGVAQSWRRALALGLVVGGALGNLVDRVRAGAVIDFIDVRVWPVFNVADIAITIGVGLLVIEVIRRRQGGER
jgi:signal peptidase II